jgi:hypothetical protein
MTACGGVKLLVAEGRFEAMLGQVAVIQMCSCVTLLLSVYPQVCHMGQMCSCVTLLLSVRGGHGGQGP